LLASIVFASHATKAYVEHVASGKRDCRKHHAEARREFEKLCAEPAFDSAELLACVKRFQKSPIGGIVPFAGFLRAYRQQLRLSRAAKPPTLRGPFAIVSRGPWPP
jgi:hypothetical protein